MSKLDELAEKIATEERTKKAIKILTANKDDWTRNYILGIYEDQKLQDVYNSIRTAVQLGKSSKDTRRLVVKYPNMIIYRFLDDVFSPKYGPEWATDKDILRKIIINEDLIRPWVVGSV